MAMFNSCSVVGAVAVLLLVCSSYSSAENDGGCSPAPPNTLIASNASTQHSSNNVPLILQTGAPSNIFRVLIGSIATLPWTVYSESQVRQFGLWCQVRSSELGSTPANNIGDWYYPTSSGFDALSSTTNDSTPYQSLKCTNQIGLVVDGDVTNYQGIVRCNTYANSRTNHVAIYSDNVFNMLKTSEKTYAVCTYNYQ